MSTQRLLPSLVLLACACATERGPVCRPEPLPAREDAAPYTTAYTTTRPQVMIDAPVAAAPAQVTLGAMTEEERTAALREAGSPIAPYTPAPFHFYVRAPCDTGSVEHELVDPYYASNGSYDTYAPASRPGYSPGFSLLRTAAYTGMGAIIGHQFHDKGAGAAIGAGLALLTTPFWGLGYGGDGWDW